MNESLPLIQVVVFKLGSVGWCVTLRPGFSVSPPQTFATKAEAMKLAKALQKAIATYSDVDEEDPIRELHACIKHVLLNRIK